jgi:hypothetical protein
LLSKCALLLPAYADKAGALQKDFLPPPRHMRSWSLNAEAVLLLTKIRSCCRSVSMQPVADAETQKTSAADDTRSAVVVELRSAAAAEAFAVAAAVY